MENERYCQNIRNSLSQLVLAVRIDGSVNLHSLNIHAEDFFIEFLNLLYDWKLKNANEDTQNAAGIDLIDRDNKNLVQVSSTCDHQKIQSSLDKSDKPEYRGYHFYFVAITEKTQKYHDFAVPEGITFDKNADVLDVETLMGKVLHAGIDKQKAMSALVDKYFDKAAAKPALRCLTALPPRADTSNVICRERELADVRKLLREGRDVLLMSGFGGIGKTSLARLVFYTVLDEYDEVAWVPYRGSLRDSMIGAFLLPETYRTPEHRWASILEYSRDGLKKLIVVDNADHIGRQDPQTDPALEALSRWPDTAVIVTSRLDELGPYQKKEIGFLSPEGCVELFYLYYSNDPERKQRAAVEKLVELAQYHSLTVELFARGAKRMADLEGYYQTLSKDLRAATRQFTTIRTGKMGTIEAHLRGLFIVQDRTEAEKRTLWSFAVLPPNAALTVEEAEKWFGLSEIELDPLAEDGWLLWKNDRYAMHPLVRQIIRLDEVPEGTAEPFLAFLEDEDNGYFLDDEVYTERIRRLELADAVLDAVCKGKDTVQVAHILHNLGRACWRLARYPEAVGYYERSLTIKEVKRGKDHTDTAATYGALANVYQDMGDLPKALEYHEKAQAIYEKVQGKEHPYTAATYNNLAGVYWAMGDLPKALEYNEKALAIRENLLGKEHPDTAQSYNNLGALYYEMKRYSEAEEVLLRSLLVRLVKLGPGHPYTRGTYGRLSKSYQALHVETESFLPWLRGELNAEEKRALDELLGA